MGGISMLVAATGKPITSLRIGRQPGYRARAYKNFFKQVAFQKTISVKICIEMFVVKIPFLAPK